MQYIGVSSPAWTIKQQENNLTENAHKILKQRKDIEKITGPGKYDQKTAMIFLHKKNEGYHFSKSIARKDNINENNCKQKHSKIQFNISNRKSTSNGKKDKSKSVSSKPQTYFTTSERVIVSKQLKNFPGPGNYEVCTQNFGLSTPISFGYKASGSVFDLNDKDITVGPGSYTPFIKTSVKGFRIVQKQSFSKIIPENIKSSIPNENIDNNHQIQIELSQKRISKKGTFCQAPRDVNPMNQKENEIPGPGKYDVLKHDANVFGEWRARAFSLRSRPKQEIISTNTKNVPHAYNINRDFFKTGKSFSFFKAHKILNPSDTSFIDDLTFQSGKNLNGCPPKVVKVHGGYISKSGRLGDCSNKNPGPANYAPDYKLVEKNPHTAIFGEHSFTKRYRVYEEQKEEPQLLDIKYQSIYPNHKLGKFGQDKKSTLENNKYSISKNGKFMMYDVRTNVGGTGFSFGHSKREGPMENEIDEKGPGFYDLKSTIPQLQPWIKNK